MDINRFLKSDDKNEKSNEKQIIEPYKGDLDGFPSSSELPEGVRSVQWDDELGNKVNYRFDVVYDERDGETLHLQILMPSKDMEGTPFDEKCPLIVYVPGSAWHKQQVYLSIPKMTRIAEHGWVVAIVQYRPSDVVSFPAQIEDAKTAIRFMRKHADEYNVDPERISIWGDSSGGHTAVMAGITGDGTLDNGKYAETSCEVNSIIDWFGPTDVSQMAYYPSTMNHISPESPEGMMLGGVNVLGNSELAYKASPMNYISKEKPIPPVLIMHGSKDELVPFNQSCILYEKLKECDKEVEMYKLENAFHGFDGFNGREAIITVMGFISKLEKKNGL